MYKTYIELVNYFESLPTDIPAIKTVTVGADEEMLDAQSSRIAYPHLRVDTPKIQLSHGDGNPTTRYTFLVYLLGNVPSKTFDAENAMLSTLLTLVEQVNQKIWEDSDTDLFDVITDTNTGDNIRRYSGDNCFGWYFALTIELHTATC